MTAHVRIDPVTKELFFYGYEADGLASTKVAYCMVGAMFNLLLRLDRRGGPPQALAWPPIAGFNEPVHVPASDPAHEGWLVMIVDQQLGEDQFLHQAWVIDAGNVAAGPVAKVTIPRRPIDDQSVGDIPWNSDDMVSFGRAIREGFLQLCTDDVERLTGCPARSVRALIEANVEMLRSA
jgi:carotenoid cleavage dioxygenase-like enzyme